MSFLERAKQAAGQARQAATATAERTSATLRDPTTIDRARTSLHLAQRGVSTAIERIDPGILAEVIIKATTLQERANTALQHRASPYRIGTVSIGASIPPSVTFSIIRLGDPAAADATSDEVAAESPPPAGPEAAPGSIAVLDGTRLSEADLAGLSATTADDTGAP